jgi:hypothetical protein
MHVNILCGQITVSFFNIKAGGTYINHWALESNTCSLFCWELNKIGPARKLSRHAHVFWHFIPYIILPNLAIASALAAYIELYFRQTQQYTNELSHTTYTLEFIGKIVQLCYMFRLISKGPNRVCVFPHLMTETDPVSETSCFSSNYLESGRWTKSEYPAILWICSSIHHKHINI